MCVVECVAVHVALRLCVSLTSFKVQFIAILVVTIAQHQITNNQVVLIVNSQPAFTRVDWFNKYSSTTLYR